ncbi:unnamed protein product [Effrenium voratum]|nr:unnamed protein product [Effrenium voratum]
MVERSTCSGRIGELMNSDRATCHSEWFIRLAVLALPAASTSTTIENSTTTTSTVPEFSYYVGDWSSCSATCEIGTRSREVFCYRTCSNPRACTSGVTEWDCRDHTIPSDSEICFGPEPVCPATSTATSSKTSTSTRTFVTLTETTQTTTRGVQAGWECVSFGSGCAVREVADRQCGPSCPCCTLSSTKVPTLPVRVTTDPPAEDGAGLPTAVLIPLLLTLVCVVGAFAVLAWRCHVGRRPKVVRRGPKAEVYGATPRQADRLHPDEPSKGTVFDRKLGRGVPSAAPDGYFDGPPEWMNDEEGGLKKDLPPFHRAFSASEHTFGAESRSAHSSPSRHRRQAPETDSKKFEPEHHEHHQRHDERPSPTAPSGTLPPGYAAAARRNRRAGKDAPDINSFGGGGPSASNIPGQANEEGEGSKQGTSPEEGRTSGGQSQGGKESQSRGHDGDAKGPSRGGTKSSAGTREGPRANPRVAADTAAAPEAADLIAQVDYELDQSQSKDLESRRRIFKALILKWHPDKNQEALAAEVFRHLMARRGGYLEA